MTSPNRDAPAQTAPPGADAVFGPRFAMAHRYAAMLCGDGVARGLIGPREPARIWTRHLLNAAALAPWLDQAAAVIDVGSGAGLPGIPLALARPDLKLTLLEPMERRVKFLEEVRDELGLELTVLRARAEEAPKHAADVVVARAVAPLDRLLAMVSPLLRPGGQLLALKGDRAAQEVEAARDALVRIRAADPQVHAIGAGDDRTFVVAVTVPGTSATVSR